MFPQENSTVVITADCNRGNRAFATYAATNDVYVHVGVITNLSAGPSGWRYVKFTWGTSDPAAQAVSLGGGKYQFTINNVRSFFGVPATETIKKISILLRNGAGTLVQRNSDGSDMFISVYGTALAGQFTLPFLEPRYNPAPEALNKQIGEQVKITWVTNSAATLKLSVNGTLVRTINSGTTLADSFLITAAGNQLIAVQAVAGAVVVDDQLSFFVPPPVVTAEQPPGTRDGINYESGDTSVVLVLFAPNKTRVSIISDLNNWTETVKDQMYQTPDRKRFWFRLKGLTPQQEYGFQYVVDGSIKITDPYAEKIQDPDNDPYISDLTYPDRKPYPFGKTTGIIGLLQTGQTPYAWKNPVFTRPDKRNLVIYELLMRDFTSNHNWKTVIDTLGYLQRLGINAIELMPVQEFEGNESWGYNPSFYFAPDKYYGTASRLREFIDSCHARGIAVILDAVLNHSFGQSPLVQLYFDGAANRPAAENPWFNPAAKHAFNVGYDMNHESAAAQYVFSRVVEHWLTQYKVDGFRFDLSKGFTQVQTCDANGNNCNVNAWGNYDASRIAIWKKYYDTLQLKSQGCYVILEHFADNSEEKELSGYGMMLWGNMNYAYNEGTMGYVNNSNLDGALYSTRGWSQPHLVSYMESHDEERLMYKNLAYGASSGSYNVRELSVALRRNELAASFLFLLPGPKLIWQFGELGYDYSINYCRNGTINSTCRLDAKPIRWDYQEEPGRKRLYEVYRGLLQLRAHPSFQQNFIAGTVQRSLSGGLKWVQLSTDSAHLVVVGNFDINPASGPVSFPFTGSWTDYFTGTKLEVSATTQTVSLQPGEYHIYLDRNVTYPLNTVTPVRELSYANGLLKCKVFPNPAVATSTLEVEVPASGKISLQLFSAQGREVGALQLFKTKGKYTLPLAALMAPSEPAGVYFLQMKFGQAIVGQKLIWQHSSQ
ncbi:MAG: alpha-amylase family glycosyl hydrolase [Chitinophagaceae bacterium]